ncbi:hypothetical protein [Campylobacter lari]|nr:hypothetical protein [Campylobacter lari]
MMVLMILVMLQYQPASNYVKSRKVCPFNEERECVLTDNKYQYS